MSTQSSLIVGRAAAVPEGWDVVPISEILTEFRGGAPLKPSDFTPIGIPVLPKGAVGRSGWLSLNDQGVQYCSPEYAQAHLANQVDNSFTIVVLRDLVPSGPSIGQIVQVKEPCRYVLAQGVYGFKLNDRAHPGFLAQMSNSSSYRRLMNSIMVGSTQVHVTNTAFKQAEILLPPPSEQRAIAAALSDADALIASLEALIAKKRAINRAATRELLSRRRRFPGYAEEWAEVTLEQCCAFITKGSTPTTYGFSWAKSGILFLRSECVSDHGLDLSESMMISEKAHAALKRSEVVGGDILITITGNVGRVVRLPEQFGPANINQHIARIRVTAPEMHPEFVALALDQEEYRRHYASVLTGQAYPQIGLKQVRDTVVPKPSLNEQKAIAESLWDIRREVSELEARLVKTRNIKQGMMQDLLSGRVRLV